MLGLCKYGTPCYWTPSAMKNFGPWAAQFPRPRTRLQGALPLWTTPSRTSLSSRMAWAPTRKARWIFHRRWIDALFTQRTHEASVRQDPWRPLLIGLCWRSDPFVGLTVHELLRALRRVNPSLFAFGRFEERAAHNGAKFGFRFLKSLQQIEDERNKAARGRLSRLLPVRYHAIGHSLGCRLLSAAVQADTTYRSCPKPLLSTLVLVQGALPSTIFLPSEMCPNVPERVSGTIIVTYSDTDTALRAYEVYHGSNLRALGSEGARVEVSARVHPEPEIGDRHKNYDVKRWRKMVTNANASNYIRTTGTAVVNVRGGHSNVCDPAVLHLIWAAVRVADVPRLALADGRAPLRRRLRRMFATNRW